jgi:hypothetical protein
VLRSLVLLFVIACCATNSFAQSGTSGTIDYTKPPADSMRVQDSLYRARKALLDKWVADQRTAAGHPQEDFISVYLAYGGLVEIQPRDITQLFFERVWGADTSTDFNTFSMASRSFLLSGSAQLAKSWGIYVEYDYTTRFSNVIADVDSSNGKKPRFKYPAEESLGLTEHGFVVGAMYILYTSRFYRLRLNGGLGGVFATTLEQEIDSTKKTVSRSASAKGYSVNFDVLNDLRVMEDLSFTIDLFTRSISTGKLTAAEGTTLDKPFGRRKEALHPEGPTASATMFGVAAGLVYYF